MYLREGSTSQNLAALINLVDAVDSRRLVVCTDERDPVDLLDGGGINTVVRKAMRLGVDGVTAVQMATLNVAGVYDLPFGRIEPGAPADMVLLSDLESWSVEYVIIDCVVVGVTHDAMARVANRLRETGGGPCVYDPKTDDCTTLSLPIAGLLADMPLRETAATFEVVSRAASWG